MITRAGKTSEAGFTLPELLISTLIVSIVLGALVSAIILALDTNETRTRLLSSHDEQLSAAYLARDVASVETYDDRSGSPCGSGALLAMAWTDPVVGDMYVDYVLDSTQEPPVLQRYACTGSGSAHVTTLASNVTAVSCVDAAGSSVACPTGADTAAVLRLAVTETNGKTFTLYGKRRITQ